MFLFWFTTLVFFLNSICHETADSFAEPSMVGVQEMMRYQVQEGIEALRKLKERAELAERENDSLTALAEQIIRDSLDVELQSKLDQLYDNKTDYRKELKFIPVTYNCGKEFDVYKLLEQVKAQRNVTTEAPKCVEDLMNEGTSCAPRSSLASTAAAAVTPQTTPSYSVKTTAPKMKAMKKLETGKKVPDTVVKANTAPVGKEQKQPEQSDKSLSGKGGLSDTHQNQKDKHQLVQTGKNKPFIKQPISAAQPQLSPITNKAPVIASPSQVKLAAPPALAPGKQVEAQPQVVPPTSKTAVANQEYNKNELPEALLKQPKKIVPMQQNLDYGESFLKNGGDQLPEIEYVYAEK